MFLHLKNTIHLLMNLVRTHRLKKESDRLPTTSVTFGIRDEGKAIT